MENLDIILLSSIVSTLFIVFLGTVVREFIKMEKNPVIEPENNIRANFIKNVGKIFDSPVKNELDANIRINKVVQDLISDMESDGVYFPEEVKKQLQKEREELWCEYSGLPSVDSYNNQKN